MDSTQQSLVDQLSQELGKSEDTDILIEWLIDAWSTREMLVKRFGEVRAMQIFTASAPLPHVSTRETALV